MISRRTPALLECAIRIFTRLIGGTFREGPPDTLANRPQDWIDAAACCEGPRPCVAFADMPEKHQRDMLFVAFSSALSITFFVTLGILLQPIPSRNLVASVPMPPPLLVSYVTPIDPAPVVRLDAPLRRLPRPRSLRPLSSVQLASVSGSPASDSRTNASAAGQKPRSNFLGRLVRGVLHTTHLKTAAD
jgi:hypothetical protein